MSVTMVSNDDLPYVQHMELKFVTISNTFLYIITNLASDTSKMITVILVVQKLVHVYHYSTRNMTSTHGVQYVERIFIFKHNSCKCATHG